MWITMYLYLCLCLQLSNLRVMWWDCDCRLFCICSQGSFFYICQVGKIGWCGMPLKVGSQMCRSLNNYIGGWVQLKRWFDFLILARVIRATIHICGNLTCYKSQLFALPLTVHHVVWHISDKWLSCPGWEENDTYFGSFLQPQISLLNSIYVDVNHILRTGNNVKMLTTKHWKVHSHMYILQGASIDAKSGR